jgi:hypothetical protein
MGIFCHKSDGKNNTTPMEDMGNDACVIVGYHNKIRCFYSKYAIFSKMENTVSNVA